MPLCTCLVRVQIGLSVHCFANAMVTWKTIWPVNFLFLRTILVIYNAHFKYSKYTVYAMPVVLHTVLAVRYTTVIPILQGGRAGAEKTASYHLKNLGKSLGIRLKEACLMPTVANQMCLEIHKQGVRTRAVWCIPEETGIQRLPLNFESFLEYL